jgi:hypothetical protein
MAKEISHKEIVTPQTLTLKGTDLSLITKIEFIKNKSRKLN